MRRLRFGIGSLNRAASEPSHSLEQVVSAAAFLRSEHRTEPACHPSGLLVAQAFQPAVSQPFRLRAVPISTGSWSQCAISRSSCLSSFSILCLLATLLGFAPSA